jgi:hypothetical protein
VGDGKADDTAALQQALDAAGKPDPDRPGRMLPATVFVPAGTYRLTRTLTLDRAGRASQVRGEGAYIGDGTRGQTTLLWDGPEGQPLFDIRGYLGLRLAELRLDGNRKAGILLRVNSVPGVGTGLWYFERLTLMHADTGFEFGKDFDSCAGDMTFADCNVSHMRTAGFRTMAFQNVDYLFLRCITSWCPIGYHFARGGNAHFLLPCFGRVRTAIKVDSGGINGGVFSVAGMQLENFNYDSEQKRLVILEAAGEVNAAFTAICTGCGNVWGTNADFTTPNFILGPSAQVSVRDSMVSGRVATLTGAEKDVATWIEFDNCRFRCASDPRKDIAVDRYSGFELRNCHVSLDDTVHTPYRVTETLMIPHFVRYPAQAGKPPKHRRSAE